MARGDHEGSVVMVVVTIVSEQCSQTNFPVIKTKPFKVIQYKDWWIIRLKWEKIKIVVIILYFL